MNNDDLFTKLYTLLSILDRNMVNYITNNSNLYEYVCNNSILLNLFITQHYYLQNLIKADIKRLEKINLDLPIIPEMIITPDISIISETLEIPEILLPLKNTPLNANAIEFHMSEYFLSSNLLDFADTK